MPTDPLIFGSSARNDHLSISTPTCSYLIIDLLYELELSRCSLDICKLTRFDTLTRVDDASNSRSKNPFYSLHTRVVRNNIRRPRIYGIYIIFISRIMKF